MTISLTYNDDLSRVVIAGSSLDSDGDTALVERSTDQIRWVTVRGGAAVELDSNAFTLSDYEFAADVPNYYRVTVDDTTETDSITPQLGTIWLKSITRPFLNTPVRLHDFSEMVRPARNGVFAVVGRSFPVARTDLRGSRQLSISVLTNTTDERRDMDLILSSGDPMFLHCPHEAPIDTMYVVIGDTSEARTPYRYTKRRIFTLPLTEVAAPDASIVGSTVNWQGIINAFADWSEVIAAADTWADLMDRIGDPSDVIVS